jgi:TetR/AcrR family transcriptional regulator, regulator of mycofactocin system
MTLLLTVGPAGTGRAVPARVMALKVKNGGRAFANFTNMSRPAAGQPPVVRQNSSLGRPPATTHAAIEEAAFSLFEQQGFEATTLDDIAAALGIGRRTLFRYYPSKNDILWGQFDDSLRHFEEFLDAVPAEATVFEAIRRAIHHFNALDPSAVAQHRQRMRFLLTTPALLAHSELRYTAWRDVIARYVAKRTGLGPSDLLPVTAGRVSLALSLSAYEKWLDEEDASFPDLLDASFDALDQFRIDHGWSNDSPTRR